MNGYGWCCKTCGQETYDSRAAFLHQQDTAHGGNALVTAETPPGPGSTDEHRAAAMAHCRSQIESAQRRHQETAK